MGGTARFRTRRRLLRGAVGLAGAALVAGCSPPAPASPSAPVRRVGRLMRSQPGAASPGFMAAFREGLRDLGWVEGRDLVIEERHPPSPDRFAEAAAELVALRPEVILVSASGDALGLREVTRTIPIVSAGTGDLVADGLAASLARPGGNVTGLSTPVIGSKQLELFREAVPGLARVAVLHDATVGSTARAHDAHEAAARPLGLQLQFLGAGGPDELEPAFEAAVHGGADGVLLATGTVVANQQPRIVDLATRHRLPSMWTLIEAPRRGGLMAYGPNRADLYRRAAGYVDKILKGANPAELPVEQPTLFEFVVNLGTARALGLAIPPAVLQQATEVIE